MPERYINADGSTETIDVPIVDHATMLTMLKFERARFLSGMPRFHSTGITATVWIHGPTPLEVIQRATNRGSVGMSFGDFDPGMFCRLLAKIAHAFAVANLGIDGFRPLVVDVITGKDTNVGQFIGGSLDDPPPPGADLHTVRWRGIMAWGMPIVLVEIRLFADMGAPVYHVAVGVATPETVAKQASATALSVKR